jgi:hypothetical protein
MFRLRYSVTVSITVSFFDPHIAPVNLRPILWGLQKIRVSVTNSVTNRFDYGFDVGNNVFRDTHAGPVDLSTILWVFEKFMFRLRYSVTVPIRYRIRFRKSKL